MLTQLISLIVENFLYFTLHLNSSTSFPPPLSQKEEMKCLEAIRNGDNNAKNKLIEHNLRLVAHIIKKYYSNNTDQEDLISIGTIGLIKGINSFDANKGARLATYVARCIDNEILMHFRASKKNAQDISMSEPIETDNEGNPLTLIDIISVEDTIIDELDLKIKTSKLYKFLNEYDNEREKEILILRYGLNMKKPLTQREIAKRMNISRSYVSRLEKRAIENLRKSFNVK
ncbi:RNA polymerase sigma-28 factor [bioreactor metagenome]|uniref:RNA polymerase sigma-28 factor n=1 Tax=bioreactor metagenome TaxID=1076179 RepID=A0A645DFG5_9ZZZZ